MKNFLKSVSVEDWIIEDRQSINYKCLVENKSNNKSKKTGKDFSENFLYYFKFHNPNEEFIFLSSEHKKKYLKLNIKIKYFASVVLWV